MRRDVTAGPASVVVLRDGDKEIEAPLYSSEGVELLDALKLKQAAEFKAMYEPTWMGVRIIQMPSDIVAIQEAIWRARPDIVVECGVAHGGSLILTASILEVLGAGRVIGVDVEIRPHNRELIEAHPLHDRIDLIEGDSVARETVERVRAECAHADRVMVVLDSNHSTDHVLAELRSYSTLVPSGGYMIVMDGAQGLVSDIPRGQASWSGDNPLEAVRLFLEENGEFEIDRSLERFGATCAPDGFLRRRAEPS